MKTTEIFKKLVTIDSPSGEEGAISNFLQNWLKENNFDVKVDNTGNVFGKREGEGRPILLCGHMDTVNPGKGIVPIIEDEIIKSKGNTILGADNKAWLAAIMNVAEQNTTKSLEILFTVGEEVDFGVSKFPIEWIKSKVCFIFDFAKPLGGIIHAAPFMDNFYIEITGQAAHSSRPLLGKNALEGALDFMNKFKIGQLDEDSVFNFGIINGGSGINVVPEKINIKGELRSFKKEKFLELSEKLKQEIQTSCEKFDLKYKFMQADGCPGYNVEENDEIIEKLKSIYIENNIKPRVDKSLGASDANWLNDMGLKTIVMADGVIDPHSTDERIAIKDLEKISSIALDMLTKI